MEPTFGERLRIARERAGYGQEQLGELIGAGRNAVGAWESGEGRLPSGKFLLKLPEVLNVSADWLLLGRPAGQTTPPREAVEALLEWMDGVLPTPKKKPGEGGGGNG